MNDGDIMVNMDANMRMRMSDWCARLRNVERSASSRRNIIIWSHCQHCQHFSAASSRAKLVKAASNFANILTSAFERRASYSHIIFGPDIKNPFCRNLTVWPCLSTGMYFGGFDSSEKLGRSKIEIAAGWRDAGQLGACYCWCWDKKCTENYVTL